MLEGTGEGPETLCPARVGAAVHMAKCQGPGKDVQRSGQGAAQ